MSGEVTCSCGWRSGHYASSVDAIDAFGEHLKESEAMSKRQTLLAALIDEYGGTAEDWTAMGSFRRVMRAIEGADSEREQGHVDPLSYSNGHIEQECSPEERPDHWVNPDPTGRTDHSRQVAKLRNHLNPYGQFKGGMLLVVDRAAASALEVHDATGINLHEWPEMLEFVRQRLVVNDLSPDVENNYA